jgi:aminoglycoside/choline kinase family phosphotransferase
VRYTAERKENAAYAGHAALLHKLGVPVPQPIAHEPRHRFSVMQDLGDLSLQEIVPAASPARVRRLYDAVLDSVVLLHGKGLACVRASRAPLAPAFTRRLYRWEHDLFLDEFVAVAARPGPGEAARLRDALGRVASRLLGEPRVLVHRDLQSSNVLVLRGRPYLIDFQGMRSGAAVYDLASLLCDPYVELERALQQDLLQRYMRAARPHRDLERIFWYAAVQRLAQALGAFGRLSRLPGCARFAEYVDPGLRMMRRALAFTEGCDPLRRLVDRLLG